MKNLTGFVNMMFKKFFFKKGSDRSMRRQYQDAMCIVRQFGRPDLFLTMTANPSWPEITENLKPGEVYIDRPDLVCRVFWIKFQRLCKMIFEDHILGN